MLDIYYKSLTLYNNVQCHFLQMKDTFRLSLIYLYECEVGIR